MLALINGIDIDNQGRCVHYHEENDVACLKRAQCGEYYACYLCHDASENHHFLASDKNDSPVLCGVCRHKMNFDEYTNGKCPYCGHAFNPNCKKHYSIYFS